MHAAVPSMGAATCMSAAPTAAAGAARCAAPVLRPSNPLRLRPAAAAPAAPPRRSLQCQAAVLPTAIKLAADAVSAAGGTGGKRQSTCRLPHFLTLAPQRVGLPRPTTRTHSPARLCLTLLCSRTSCAEQAGAFVVIYSSLTYFNLRRVRNAVRAPPPLSPPPPPNGCGLRPPHKSLPCPPACLPACLFSLCHRRIPQSTASLQVEKVQGERASKDGDRKARIAKLTGQQAESDGERGNQEE